MITMLSRFCDTWCKRKTYNILQYRYFVSLQCSTSTYYLILGLYEWCVDTQRRDHETWVLRTDQRFPHGPDVNRDFSRNHRKSEATGCNCDVLPQLAAVSQLVDSIRRLQFPCSGGCVFSGSRRRQWFLFGGKLWVECLLCYTFCFPLISDSHFTFGFWVQCSFVHLSFWWNQWIFFPYCHLLEPKGPVCFDQFFDLLVSHPATPFFRFCFLGRPNSGWKLGRTCARVEFELFSGFQCKNMVSVILLINWECIY